MGRAQGSPEEVALNRRQAAPAPAEPYDEQAFEQAFEQAATTYLTSSAFLDELIGELEQLLPEEIHSAIGVGFAGLRAQEPGRLGQLNTETRNLLLYEGNLTAPGGAYAYLPAAAAALVMRGVLRHEGLHARYSTVSPLLGRVENFTRQLVENQAPADSEFFWLLLNKLEDGRIEHIDAVEDPDGHRAIAIGTAMINASPTQTYRVTKPEGASVPWTEQYVPVDIHGQPLSVRTLPDGSRVVQAEAGREISDDIWGEKPLTSNLSVQALAALHQHVRPAGRIKAINERVAQALKDSEPTINHALSGNEHDVLAAAWIVYNIFRRHRLTPDSATGNDAPLQMPAELFNWLKSEVAKDSDRRQLAARCPASGDELTAAFEVQEAHLRERLLKQRAEAA